MSCPLDSGGMKTNEQPLWGEGSPIRAVVFLRLCVDAVLGFSSVTSES